VILVTTPRTNDHARNYLRKAKIASAMKDFAVLTNRKRALIALVHSVFFLGVALRGFASPREALVLHGSRAATGVALIAIYLIVASILIWLVKMSRCAIERAYFALCATSATFGLLRTIFGDAALPAAQPLRVLMLTSAVAVGVSIFRSFSRPVPENVLPD
jgi:hypothetical protein